MSQLDVPPSGPPPTSKPPLWLWFVAGGLILCVGAVLGFLMVLRPLLRSAPWQPSEHRPEEHHAEDELAARGIRFPGYALDEDLLSEVAAWTRGGTESVCFAEDEDGRTGLFVATYGAWVQLGPSGDELARHRTEGWPSWTRSVPVEGGRRVGLEVRGSMHFADDEEIVATLDGEALWSRRSGTTGWIDQQLATSADGELLVLFYDYDEFVLSDLEGRVRWETDISAYGARCHPDLPGFFLTFFGDLSWYRVDDGEVLQHRFQPPHAGYVKEAELYPAPDGTPRILAVGSTEVDAMTLDGAAEWTASIGCCVTGLAMLEPEGRPRCFAVTTRVGDLFLVDETGRLLHHRTVPQEPHEEIDVAVYTMDAGPFEDGTWGIAIEFLQWTVVYRLDPDRLPE